VKGVGQLSVGVVFGLFFTLGSWRIGHALGVVHGSAAFVLAFGYRWDREGLVSFPSFYRSWQIVSLSFQMGLFRSSDRLAAILCPRLPYFPPEGFRTRSVGKFVNQYDFPSYECVTLVLPMVLQLHKLRFVIPAPPSPKPPGIMSIFPPSSPGLISWSLSNFYRRRNSNQDLVASRSRCSFSFLQVCICRSPPGFENSH